jgi:uncharacterized protein DUF5818
MPRLRTVKFFPARVFSERSTSPREKIPNHSFREFYFVHILARRLHLLVHPSQIFIERCIMKRLTIFAIAAGLLACTIPLATGWTANHTKQPSTILPATPDLFDQQSSQAQQQQAPVKTFTGKISKSGQQFVLEDPATKAAYQLDDQKKAKQYENKNVRVTGTLDADGNIIHVQSIEEAV